MADELRTGLAKLVRELLAEGEADRAGEPIAPRLWAHLGDGARELPVLTEALDDWELPNLHLGLDALLARPGWSADVIGLTGRHKRYEEFSLSDLMTKEPYLPCVGPPEYANAAVGPGRTMPCLEFAILLFTSPDGPITLFVRRGGGHGVGPPRLALQAVAPGEGVAARVFADLRALMHEHDSGRHAIETRSSPAAATSRAGWGKTRTSPGR